LKARNAGYQRVLAGRDECNGHRDRARQTYQRLPARQTAASRPHRSEPRCGIRFDLPSERDGCHAFITGIYVGRSVQHCPPGSLVVFPYEPQTVSCGITALVAFKRTAPSDGSLQTLHRTLDDIAAYTWDRLKAQELDPVIPYLGGPERLGRMRVLGARLKEPAPFYEVYADRAGLEQVSALAQRLAALVHAEDRMRLEQTGQEAPPIGDVMAARLTALRDILWSLVARARRKGRLSCCSRRPRATWRASRP
jgi:hypothetical protein